MKHGKETCVWKVFVSSAKASILSSESWFSPNNSSWLFSLLLSQLLLVRIRSSAEPTCVCREWLVDVLIELRTAQTWSNLYFHKASVAAALLPLFTKGFYYWCILQLLRALYDVLYTSFSNGIVLRRWFTLKKKPSTEIETPLFIDNMSVGTFPSMGVSFSTARLLRVHPKSHNCLPVPLTCVRVPPTKNAWRNARKQRNLFPFLWSIKGSNICFR